MSVEQVPLIPPIPPRLRLAAREGTVVPFVGSGVSQLIGCPGWSELADSVLRPFVDAGHMDHAHYSQVRQLSARTKLSIACRLERNVGVAIDWESALSPPNADDARARQVVRDLWRLGPCIVTTNYDNWLDRPLPIETDTATPEQRPSAAPPSAVHVLDDDAEITPAVLGREGRTVIHLHGRIGHPERMVLTTADYGARYSTDREPKPENPWLRFLEALFRDRTVLFVGYGLNEIEIIEHLVNKAGQRERSRSPEARHFMLKGFYSYEAPLLNSIRAYMADDLGIEVLPYSRDARDWRQLSEVLKHFASEIPSRGPLRTVKAIDMERWLDEC